MTLGQNHRHSSLGKTEGHAHGAHCQHGIGGLVSTNSGKSSSTKNIAIALILNFGFAIVELVGGFWTHSTAIQADAIHDFGDSAVLLLALAMQWFARVKPTATYGFGFKRLSLVSALMMSMTLIASSLFLVKLAWSRFHEPADLHLNGMLFLAILGVSVNGFAAWKVGHGHTQNEKAISWHMIEDLLGWVAVLISSIVMRFVDVSWLDPLLAIVIAFIVIFGGMKSFWSSFKLFLQAAPFSVDSSALRADFLKVPGIVGIQDFQIWSLDGEHHVLNVHVLLQYGTTIEEWTNIKKSLADLCQGYGQIKLTVEPDFSQIGKPILLNHSMT